MSGERMLGTNSSTPLSTCGSDHSSNSTYQRCHSHLTTMHNLPLRACSLPSRCRDSISNQVSARTTKVFGCPFSTAMAPRPIPNHTTFLCHHHPSPPVDHFSSIYQPLNTKQTISSMRRSMRCRFDEGRMKRGRVNVVRGGFLRSQSDVF